MRKSGPLRNIRLCAYTVVGTDSSVTGVVTARDAAPTEAAEGAGALAGVDDLRCHNTHTNMQVGTAMRTMRRARIQIHSMGTVISTVRPRRKFVQPARSRRSQESTEIHSVKMRIHDHELIRDLMELEREKPVTSSPSRRKRI